LDFFFCFLMDFLFRQNSALAEAILQMLPTDRIPLRAAEVWL